MTTDHAGGTPDPLTAALDEIEARNEHYIRVLGLTEATVATLPSGDLRKLLAVARAVLALPGRWDESDDGPASALTEDRGWVRAACARDLRETITRVLLGEENNG